MIDTAAEQRIYDATTQGERREREHSRGLSYLTNDKGNIIHITTENAAWIAHTHNVMQAMLAEIANGREAQRKLMEAIEVAREIVQSFDSSKDYQTPGTCVERLIVRLRRIAEGGQSCP